MLSVAVVVRTRLSPACPHLLFREATLSHPVKGQGWESGSSSEWDNPPSDGSPICPSRIIPRYRGRVKAFSAVHFAGRA
jgi:hypothetical protein